MPIKVVVPPIDTVRVRVNTTPAVRVQSIQYIPGKSIADSTDIVFGDTLSNRSILTYNPTTEKFVVQDAPQINGGTF